MTIWFTSDSHFGHDAIVRLADRPFGSCAEMDTTLIQRWNSVVAAGDTVWHLGDFAHKSAASVAAYRTQLNGTIHLVSGNHDQHILKSHRDLFASIQSMAEVHTAGRTIILCHYPLREWDKAWRGSWHLHGHVHGRFDDPPYGFSLDVGVDSHDFTPINAQQIAALMQGRKTPFVQTEDRAEQSRLQNDKRRANAMKKDASS